MVINKPPYNWNREQTLINASFEDILYELRYRFMAETVAVRFQTIYANGHADYVITIQDAHHFPSCQKGEEEEC